MQMIQLPSFDRFIIGQALMRIERHLIGTIECIAWEGPVRLLNENCSYYCPIITGGLAR